MKNGKTLNSGDVILTTVQFTDTHEVKTRPAVILFEEFENVIVAGVTSNLKMIGIPLTKEEGAIKESIIKLNYIFTISKIMVSKVLFSLSPKKRELVYNELVKKLSNLVENDL
ncbi:MAG TPA: type II toxin-antitoxin system PemK/MazF family toxin [Candidatus Deferrimicrobium sp.]|nr:type II toxin-antitoxin system PemK/MazF family toxin [Candidatus Deferrimicrobium sp.]